jgi:heme exporter protein D
MNTVQAWFNMGGYAGYIWPAYGMVFGVFLLHIVHAKLQKKRVLKQLKRWCESQ